MRNILWVTTVVAVILRIPAGHAQQRADTTSVSNTRDSVAGATAKHPLLSRESLGIQLLAGEVSYAIPFWSVAYFRIQRDKGQFSNTPDPLLILGLGLASTFAPIGIDLTLQHLGWERGNVVWGIVGSFLGVLVGRFAVQSDAAYSALLYSGAASVVVAMLFYDLFK